jgi:hypothetical protein
MLLYRLERMLLSVLNTIATAVVTDALLDHILVAGQLRYLVTI